MLKNRFKKKNDEKSKLETLKSMGFPVEEARHALAACDNDLERASNFLLGGSSTNNNSSNTTNTTNNSGRGSGRGTSNYPEEETEEQQLQRIMAESLATEEQRKAAAAAGTAGTTTTVATRKPASAAAIKAGQAAAARAENASRRYGANGKLLAKKKTTTKTKEATSSSTKASQSQSINSTSMSTSIGGLKIDNTVNNNNSNFNSNNNNNNNNKSKQAVLKSHPKVKMPTQMKDKSKEEQILRCTKRIAPHPLAVDTLLRAFMFIRQNPNEEKYRKIDRTTAGFQSALEGKPGVMDLLSAMNFIRSNGDSGNYSNISNNNQRYIILERARVDMALLYLGISALEEVRKSEEYLAAKQSIQFEKELNRIKNGEGSDSATSEEDEILKRAEYISKLPTEPSGGAGALMQISLGANHKIMRKFDGDDILLDVIHFIGGHGSAIPEKILSREWCLVDLNQYPSVVLDTELFRNKTLQFIGCWPSGKLSLQPSSSEWREGKEIGERVDVGGSRGLGAAPSSL